MARPNNLWSIVELAATDARTTLRHGAKGQADCAGWLQGQADPHAAPQYDHDDG
jgi:hypothetical protein